NSPALKDPSASLLSPLKDSRRVARDIAVAVGIEAQKEGLAPKTSEDELRQRVLKAQWTPTYPTFSELGEDFDESPFQTVFSSILCDRCRFSPSSGRDGEYPIACLHRELC